MKQRAFTIRLREYDRLEDLTQSQSDLVGKAVEAARNAYAPYSGFHVGAAVLLANGEIFTGNNQENAAYPSGLCAERVAIFYAGSHYPDVPVVSMAIAAIRNGSILTTPVSPCGGCRQVMIEKESVGGTPMEIILYGTEKIQVIRSASELLPLPFKFSKK
jgi:cytidine deaminase